MDRKHLVKTLSEHFGVKAEYMAAPSFAYQIKTEDETYTIDREGKIITSTGEEMGLEELLNGPENETPKEKVEGPMELSTEGEPLKLELKLPMEGHSGRTLRNLTNMIYSKQALIKKALELEENLIEENFSIGMNQVRIETLEDFKKALEDIGEKSCPGINFDFCESTITFKITQAPEKMKTTTQLFALINENVLAQKNASPKAKPTDNEKYTFRTWLLRLGMVGEEYKAARKALLQNLSGNGAFRKTTKGGDTHEA
ncbi:hypothetical protein GGQ84_001369 [Desulfitispora alkaliphila]|uniref:virulence-related protein n=1 Tax=Desulfitispora alkaliphila TaxID=622674 RepID=UPI003D204C1D